MTFLLFSGRPEWMARFAPCGTVATARSCLRKVEGTARRLQNSPRVDAPGYRQPATCSAAGQGDDLAVRTVSTMNTPQGAPP